MIQQQVHLFWISPRIYSAFKKLINIDYKILSGTIVDIAGKIYGKKFLRRSSHLWSHCTSLPEPWSHPALIRQPLLAPYHLGNKAVDSRIGNCLKAKPSCAVHHKIKIYEMDHKSLLQRGPSMGHTLKNKLKTIQIYKYVFNLMWVNFLQHILCIQVLDKWRHYFVYSILCPNTF
jgi:hypothetical protein